MTFCNPLSHRESRRKQRKPELVSDAFLAQEMNELSVTERETVYDEIHGVAKIPEETEEFIAECIEKLRLELPKIPRMKRKALERARFLRPSLELDTKFNVMFLRAERYDAAKAALRMCRFFRSKLELFGDDKLAKSITLDDLDEEDMVALRTSSFHQLPQKDQGGRGVMFTDMRFFSFKAWKSQTRYIFYQVMVALEDEEIQKVGCVNVMNCNGLTTIPTHFTELITKGAPMLKDLPLKMTALHFCYGDPRMRPFLSSIQMVAGTQNRLRFRTHCGTDLEVQYALLTFGIRLADRTTPSDGSISRIEATKQYIQMRREEELEQRREQNEKEESTKCFLHPNRNDILLGRGKPFQTFTGNCAMQQLLDAIHDQYLNATERLEKTRMAIEIVKKIEGSGGRFVQRINDVGWQRVDGGIAREKVCQALRTKTRYYATKADAKEESSYFAHVEDCKRMRFTNESSS